MIARRAGEVRVIHVVIVLVLLVLIGTPIAIFVGWLAIPSFNLFGVKTPELSKKKIEQAVDETVDTASGFTAAKTPTEAIDKFRTAIQARNYKAAKKYVTNDYANVLDRSHTAAADLGKVIDRIRKFGKDNGILSDNLAYVLFNLDPFPTAFSVAKTEQKGDKAYCRLKWEYPPKPKQELMSEIQQFDLNMFQHVLGTALIFDNAAAPLELVKDGEEWKLKVPTNPQWDQAVSYYLDHCKTYQTGLDSLAADLNRNRYDNPREYEKVVFTKLRNAKN